MSDGWVGGLPPAAVARMQRMRADGVRTSFLSVPDLAAARMIGMSPVGEVMGCTVVQLGWRGWGGCGAYGFGSWSGGGQTNFGTFGPYTDAVRAAYRKTLDRLRAEAQALGADGVVGVRFSVSPLGASGGAEMSESNSGDVREYLATGSAVRVAGEVRPRTPFLTDRTATDTAKLMAAGWMPASIAIGLSVAIRHDDYNTQRQASSMWSGNTEVTGYTELVAHARDAARRDFARDASLAQPDGALMSAMSLRVWEIEPGEGHRDHVAEAFVAGTTVAQYSRALEEPRALSILPLRDRK